MSDWGDGDDERPDLAEAFSLPGDVRRLVTSLGALAYREPAVETSPRRRASSVSPTST